MKELFTCSTRLAAGDNVTSTVNGKRASATMSPQEAVRRLAEKLGHAGPVVIQQVPGTSPQVWRVLRA